MLSMILYFKIYSNFNVFSIFSCGKVEFIKKATKTLLLIARFYVVLHIFI